MFDFKAYIIKQFIKVKVIDDTPGKLTLKVPNSLKVEEEYRWYDEFVARGIKILNGIEDVKFNYDSGTILFIYETNKVSQDKILKWVNVIIDVVVKNLKFIEDNGENNLDYVINTLEQKLQEKVKEF